MNVNELIEKRKGFESPYKLAYEEGWDLKNLGFDYNSQLMNKTLSSYMFRNGRLATFINDHLNPIMVMFINKVKYLRIYYNYAVPKDYQNIN
jgi:hypothetical protein